MLGIVRAPDGEQGPKPGTGPIASCFPVTAAPAPPMLGGNCLFMFPFLDMNSFRKPESHFLCPPSTVGKEMAWAEGHRPRQYLLSGKMAKQNF